MQSTISPADKWSFRIADPESWRPVYEKMREEGLLTVVFYDCEFMSPEHFAHLARTSVMLLIEQEGALCGAVWLRDLHARTGSIHFCFFKEGRDACVPLGRRCLQHIFQWAPLDSLYGVTPQCYRAAVRYISAVGGRILGSVPGACCLWHHKNREAKTQERLGEHSEQGFGGPRGRVVPAIISVMTNKECA